MDRAGTRPGADAARLWGSPMNSAVDYAQAGELKIGQVGIANLRVRTLDVDKLAAEMRDRVQRAPSLFARAAIVLDFGGLTQAPDIATARALVAALRDVGVLPVALAYGTTEIDTLSQALGLPLLAKFRAQYERADAAAPASTSAPARTTTTSRAETATPQGGPGRCVCCISRRVARPSAGRASAVRPADLRRQSRPHGAVDGRRGR